MIIYLFLDGIGFGKNDPTINPFSKYARSFFLPLADRKLPDSSTFSRGEYVITDPAMGIKGLPQSATGQTALWTGVNAPEVLGRHVSGFPTFTLKKIITEFSIIKILKSHGFKASFLNCYSPIYFQRVTKNNRYLSASTLIQHAADTPLRDLDDLRNERGLFMDITHELFREFSKEFLDENDSLKNLRDPFEMGRKVKDMGGDNDVILFEYFLSDKAGHAMDWNFAQKVIENLEAFLEGILENFSISEDQLIVTSDHGNLEDLSTKVHTNNKVPTYLLGKYTESMKDRITSLCDIPPAIYSALGFDFIPNYQKLEEK